MSIYPGPYKFVVEFEKAISKGTLAGLTIKDRIHFADKRDAEEWIAAVSKFNRDGRYFNFRVKEAA